MNKKTWIILAGVVLIIAGGLFLYSMNTKQTPKPIEVTTTELDKAKIPTGLPTNLPVEAGSKVLQNYESRTNDNRLQSTRQITSEKTAKGALDFYVAFFKKLGYSGGYSESSSTADGQQIAIMKNDEDLLMIVATPKDKNTSEVEFTLTQKAE